MELEKTQKIWGIGARIYLFYYFIYFISKAFFVNNEIESFINKTHEILIILFNIFAIITVAHLFILLNASQKRKG
jgi:hypothetical protein